MTIIQQIITVATLACIAGSVAACGGDSTPSAPSGVPAGSNNSGSAGGTSSGVQLTDDFAGRALFPADNWWNQDISSAPVDPQSDAYVDFIGRARTAHPDFGPPPYGIPFIGVSGSETRRVVTFVD